MRKVFFLAVILLASFAIYASSRERAPKAAHIVAFGDSLTYGTGSSRGGGFVSVLSDDIHMPIKNMGVPGDTTEDALKRLPTVIAEKPTVTIVLFGGNDLRQGMPAIETAKNLALINAALKHAGSRVLLLNIGMLEGIWGKPEFMSDALHPNDKGYALIAERVRPSLEALLRQPF